MDTQGKENLVSTPHTPSSPSFLKPKPIRLRKRANQTKTLPLASIPLNYDKSDSCGFLRKSPKTAINPFRRNENKRKRDIESANEDSNSLLWKQVNRTFDNTTAQTKTLPSPVVPSMLDECALSSFSDTVFPPLEEKKETSSQLTAKELPVDWSLKTKVRFTSATAFPFRGSFRTFEEVNGTVGFVKGIHPGESDKASGVHSSHGAKLFQHSLVWMAPCLPWLNLFPRSNNTTMKQIGSSIMSQEFLEKLYPIWSDSFRSLCQMVKVYQCPYFYLCAPTFTALFRSAGVASFPVMHALISPTTKGFRKALQEEGITFSMPLCQNKDLESSVEETLDEDSPISSPPDEDENEFRGGESDGEEEEEPESWLESLGLSQDNFPSLKKKKRRGEIAHKIDHKQESLVYIEVNQALINFLNNSPFCMSKIGPMAGFPPTLLAPTAFLGGTLKSLQICHGKVKQGNREMDSVEISGPLLPNAVHSLCSLFNQTQDGSFSAVLTSHAPTNPFALITPEATTEPSIFAKNNLADCGQSSAFIHQMCSKTNEAPLRTLTAEKGVFTLN